MFMWKKCAYSFFVSHPRTKSNNQARKHNSKCSIKCANMSHQTEMNTAQGHVPDIFHITFLHIYGIYIYISIYIYKCVCVHKQNGAFYGRVTTAKARGCGRRSGEWGATRSPSKLIFEITTSFLKSAFQIRACPLSFNASFCEVINLRIRHTSFSLLR